jgi:hypothetical protein
MGSQMSDNSQPSIPGQTGQVSNTSKMSGSLRNWSVLLVVLIVVALLAALWATYNYYPTYIQPYFPFGRAQPPFANISGDWEFFYVAKTVVSTINVSLLVYLLITYAGIYAKTRSQFTIGLMLFSIALLIKDLTASPLVIWAFHYILVGLGPFALIPDLFEFVALMVLFYLSVRY